MKHTHETPAGGIGEQSPASLALSLTLAAGLAAVATRLLTAAGLWPWNLTPVGVLGLYGGARLRSWRAFVLPVAIMAATDVILWAVKGWLAPFNPFVYASFAIYVLLGRLLRRTESPVRVGTACLVGTAQFFLLTNLGAWLASSKPPEQMPAGEVMVTERTGEQYSQLTYARNVQGLLACYVAAIPFTNPDAPPLGFLGNTMLGDIGFAALLFGAHAWLSRRYLLSLRGTAHEVCSHHRIQLR